MIAAGAIAATLVAQPFQGRARGAESPALQTSFVVERSSEAIATVRAACERCDWSATGREAAALRVSVDGRYRTHVMLTQGYRDADYQVLLGRYGHGSHRVTVDIDPSQSAPQIGTVRVSGVDVTVVGSRNPGFEALAHAPILHARPNTIGRFTDVPLLMWYETAPTAHGRSYRYSVVFSNEDGGTATDRLMATWGRTTDIEFVYGIEIDEAGRVVAEEFQGPNHVMTPFRGRHEASHPLEWTVTDNNMVSDRGTTTMRYAPAPERFDLTDVSREVVMDAHPWTYRVSTQEMMREGKIGADPAAGSGTIPDPQRYVFVEACTELAAARLSFGVHAKTAQGAQWFDSDRGRDEFRIVRSGCYRGAVPLPTGVSAPDAIRFRAWPQPDAKEPAAVRVTRVNRVFTLGDDLQPKPSMFQWMGSLPLTIDGSPRELSFSR